MRKIEVGGAIYHWNIGKAHVQIEMPDGKKASPYIYEVGHIRDFATDWSVTPADVRRWIELVLLKK